MVDGGDDVRGDWGIETTTDGCLEVLLTVGRAHMT
jgi:hypothetical protein